jgi:hypothetical protein
VQVTTVNDDHFFNKTNIPCIDKDDAHHLADVLGKMNYECTGYADNRRRRTEVCVRIFLGPLKGAVVIPATDLYDVAHSLMDHLETLTGPEQHGPMKKTAKPVPTFFKEEAAE